ncbi:MAG TPA: PEP-CTERM sorting domain-containing protein [Oxalicibacterium sp.]|nr:PEP-CTERM sorting domain-containing protein [Oxalicibacterium sp.]
MQTIRSIATFGALTFSLAGMDAVADDTRFTYTSDALEWDSSRIYGDGYAQDYDATPIFTVSFVLAGNWLGRASPATFTIPGRPDITISTYTMPFTFAPNAVNSVTVGQNGDVTDWNFSFRLDPVFIGTGDPLNDAVEELGNRRAKIFSKYGPALCDCDVVQLRYNKVTILSGGNPFLLGPAGIDYRGNNQAGNWSLALVSAVPEPSSYLMMLGGLALLGAFAKRQKQLVHSRFA